MPSPRKAGLLTAAFVAIPIAVYVGVEYLLPVTPDIERAAPSVLLPGPGGERLYSLLIVQRRPQAGRNRSRRTHGVDLVVHDPATAKEVGRHPLVHREDELPLRNESDVFGFDGRRLWSFVDRLYGFEPVGETLTSIDQITAVNPFLSEQWLPEHKHYQLNEESKRLTFRTADGRTWALDPATLKAMATEPLEQQRRPKDMKEYGVLQRTYDERYDVQHNGVKAYWRPRARFDQREWFGLLSDEEARKIRDAKNWEEPRQGYQETDVRRFWLVRLKPTVDAWNEPRLTLDTMQPAGSGTYIQGGVVRRPFSDGPVALANPPGYLVLHRSRIDKEGTLLFTRVDAAGNPVWSVDTRLVSVPQIVPAERFVAVIGRPLAKAGEREHPYRLVSVRTADGARFDEPFR
ncbi:MAG: PA2928 family protein [Bryobacteraceae bacterium]|nr:PA2928 family protein [Bryobacteraceae bacterium]